MRPRITVRGYRGLQAELAATLGASMRPRITVRGYPGALVQDQIQHLQLQCGHGSQSVDIAPVSEVAAAAFEEASMRPRITVRGYPLTRQLLAAPQDTIHVARAPG